MKQLKNDDVATKQDLQRLEEKIDTNASASDKKFAKWLENSMTAFRREMEHHQRVSDEKWDAKFLALESRILTAIDPLLKELKTRQEERIVLAAQLKHNQDDITDLQKRVTKLEAA